MAISSAVRGRANLYGGGVRPHAELARDVDAELDEAVRRSVDEAVRRSVLASCFAAQVSRTERSPPVSCRPVNFLCAAFFRATKLTLAQYQGVKKE